jgi:hypothetical protein
MIASYKRKSNIAGAVFLAAIVADVALIWTGHKDLWANGAFAAVFGITWAASYFYALWCYIKAKGRSDAWILMTFLSVLGLIVLLLLKDHCKDGAPRLVQQAVPKFS